MKKDNCPAPFPYDHPDTPHEPPCPPPDMPEFCPPVPVPRPCKPRVPSTVVPGMDLYESMCLLSGKVDAMEHTFNGVMAENYATLNALRKSGEAQGSYYNDCEVTTEQGYYAEESAAYTITRKAVVDKHGHPIRMQLHLAYGNTTNSEVVENIQHASLEELADKMFTAVPISPGKGWYGTVMYNGAPLPSSDAPELYTVGFTKKGAMKVYSNGASPEQLRRDTVEYAMGVPGVLIQNGELTGDEWRNKIPNYTTQVERIAMGQNTKTGEVFILTCGNENDVNRKGMTSAAVAKILLGYGCTVAVEVMEGVESMALDKGSLMYIPTNDELPEAYAFWYISKKCEYRNDYQRELAITIQRQGMYLWEAYLNYQRQVKLRADLEQEILDRIAADEVLQGEIDQLEADLAAEIERAIARENEIAADLAAEIERAKAEETRIEQESKDRDAAEQARAEAEEARIEQESKDRDAAEQARAEAAEENLQSQVTDLYANITRIDANIDALEQALKDEETARIAADTNLQTQVTDLRSDLTILQNTVQANYNTMLQITGGLRNDVSALQATFADLQTQVTAIDNQIVEIFQSIAEMKLTLISLENTSVDHENRITELETCCTEAKAAIADLQEQLENIASQYVQSVNNGEYVSEFVYIDNTDPKNPTIQTENLDELLYGIVDGTNLLPYVKSVTGANVDNTDPLNPVITGGGGSDDYVKKTGDTMSGPLLVAHSNGIGLATLEAVAGGAQFSGKNYIYFVTGGDSSKRSVLLAPSAGATGAIFSGLAPGVLGTDSVNVDQLNASYKYNSPAAPITFTVPLYDSYDATVSTRNATITPAMWRIGNIVYCTNRISWDTVSGVRNFIKLENRKTFSQRAAQTFPNLFRPRLARQTTAIEFISHYGAYVKEQATGNFAHALATFSIRIDTAYTELNISCSDFDYAFAAPFMVDLQEISSYGALPAQWLAQYDWDGTTQLPWKVVT